MVETESDAADSMAMSYDKVEAMLKQWKHCVFNKQEIVEITSALQRCGHNQI